MAKLVLSLTLSLITVIQTVVPCCAVEVRVEADKVSGAEFAATCWHAGCGCASDEHNSASDEDPSKNGQPDHGCPYCESSVVLATRDSGERDSLGDDSTGCERSVRTDCSLLVCQSRFDRQRLLHYGRQPTTVCRLQI